jgi:hypothetical protein
MCATKFATVSTSRGNKLGVNAQFTPPQEQLAFSIKLPEEADFPAILAEPLALVVAALRRMTTWDEMLLRLPDISWPVAQDYGLVSSLGVS